MRKLSGERRLTVCGGELERCWEHDYWKGVGCIILRGVEIHNCAIGRHL